MKQITITFLFILSFTKNSLGTMPCPPVYTIPNPFYIDFYHFDHDVIKGLRKSKQHQIVTTTVNRFGDTSKAFYYYNERYTLDSIIKTSAGTLRERNDFTYNQSGYVTSSVLKEYYEDRKGRTNSWGEYSQIFNYDKNTLISYQYKIKNIKKHELKSESTIDDIRLTSNQDSIQIFTAYTQQNIPSDYSYVIKNGKILRTMKAGTTIDSLVYSTSDCKTFLDAYESGVWKHRTCYNQDGKTLYLQTGWSSWMSDSLPIVSEEHSYNIHGQPIRLDKNWNCSPGNEITNYIRNSQTGLISSTIKLRYDVRLKDYRVIKTYYKYLE